MLFLISYKFTDANAQEKGSKMLKEWYDKGGPQNRPEGYDVQSWIFLPQHGNGYSVVDADSLETIWKQLLSLQVVLSLNHQLLFQYL